MAKTVMYTVAIATLSILLISVLAFDAEAKKFSDATHLKGGFSTFDQVRGPSADKIMVSLSEIKDSNDVSIDYTVRDASGEIAVGVNCTGSKQIMKISSMNSASIKFDTADLDCTSQSGKSGVISANLQAREGEDKEKKNQMDVVTGCVNEGDMCFRLHGYTQTVSAIGEATAFGVSIDVKGDFGKINVKKTSWIP